MSLMHLHQEGLKFTEHEACTEGITHRRVGFQNLKRQFLEPCQGGDYVTKTNL